MAIADLIEAVERGEWPAQMMNPIEASEHLDLAEDAYHGDLNAAVALLEAVLPGWCYTIDVREGGWTRAWTDERSGLRRPGHSGSCNDNPARALLLAILKALAAKEPTDD